MKIAIITGKPFEQDLRFIYLILIRCLQASPGIIFIWIMFQYSYTEFKSTPCCYCICPDLFQFCGDSHPAAHMKAENENLHLYYFISPISA